MPGLHPIKDRAEKQADEEGTAPKGVASGWSKQTASDAADACDPPIAQEQDDGGRADEEATHERRQEGAHARLPTSPNIAAC